jgi:Family of unknown function (DUF6221)
MSSEEEGPVAWLRAAITERLELARKATQAPWEPEGGDPTDDEVWIDVDGEGWRHVICRGPQSHENMLHIAASDPRDTIARCQAELAILDEHYILYNGDRNEKYEQFSIISPPFPPRNCGCVTCHYASRGGVSGYGICRTVKYLASGYRHQPGYREDDWKPGVTPWKAPSERPD